MTPDEPREPGVSAAPAGASRGASPADADLARMVRDIAAGWSMPPVRLDQPGWRERARSPRNRRAESFRGFAGRVGRAAGAAIALTAGAAVLGVWLTRPTGPTSPSQRPGQSPSGTPRPAPSAVAASQLPKLLVNGDLPSPSQLIVSVESTFSLVDLGTGTIGQAMGQGQWGTDVRRAPNGVLYCICLGGDAYASGSFTRMTVTWNSYGAAGSVSGSAAVGEFQGAPDPRDVGFTEQSQHVAVRVTYGVDPRIAFVGWTIHAHPVWKSGIVLVDVTTGDVIQRFDLPNTSDGTDASRTAADAPRVIGTIGGGRVVIARPGYSWSPADATNPAYHFGTETWVATFDGTRLAGAETLSVASGCGDDITEAGALVGGTWWLGCISVDAGQSVVRRVAADGHVLGDTLVTGVLDFGDPTATSAISPDGRVAYLWSPVDNLLTRIDLATGDRTTGTGDETSAAAGPLAALGRWLTPAVAAKVLLSPGIVVSPDGARIYALGIKNSQSGNELAGSTGVFVFDAGTLHQVAHWTATADFVSLALSPDGRYLYTAGSPEANAAGTETTRAASITVFDTSDGTIRLIAGQLGSGFLLFPSTIAR